MWNESYENVELIRVHGRLIDEILPELVFAVPLESSDVPERRKMAAELLAREVYQVSRDITGIDLCAEVLRDVPQEPWYEVRDTLARVPYLVHGTLADVRARLEAIHPLRLTGIPELAPVQPYWSAVLEAMPKVPVRL